MCARINPAQEATASTDSLADRAAAVAAHLRLHKRALLAVWETTAYPQWATSLQAGMAAAEVMANVLDLLAIGEVQGAADAVTGFINEAVDSGAVEVH